MQSESEFDSTSFNYGKPSFVENIDYGCPKRNWTIVGEVPVPRSTEDRRGEEMRAHKIDATKKKKATQMSKKEAEGQAIKETATTKGCTTNKPLVCFRVANPTITAINMHAYFFIPVVGSVGGVFSNIFKESCIRCFFTVFELSKSFRSEKNQDLIIFLLILFDKFLLLHLCPSSSNQLLFASTTVHSCTVSNRGILPSGGEA